MYTECQESEGQNPKGATASSASHMHSMKQPSDADRSSMPVLEFNTAALPPVSFAYRFVPTVPSYSQPTEVPLLAPSAKSGTHSSSFSVMSSDSLQQNPRSTLSFSVGASVRTELKPTSLQSLEFRKSSAENQATSLSVLYKAVKWAKSLPGFLSLSLRDQVLYIGLHSLYNLAKR